MPYAYEYPSPQLIIITKRNLANGSKYGYSRGAQISATAGPARFLLQSITFTAVMRMCMFYVCGPLSDVRLPNTISHNRHKAMHET